jgi:hypothetical protein
MTIDRAMTPNPRKMSPPTSIGLELAGDLITGNFLGFFLWRTPSGLGGGAI